MTGPTLVLDGSAIHDIAGFYAEINRVFMTSEDWQLAPSLDALDDLLYGGYGAPVHWTHIAHSRAALGVAATRAWLQEKQARPGVFNAARIATQLDALERGAGQTYFDLIMDVFAAHPTLHLRTD
ncbi:barstar (barnase inhibitor) [Stenotrophomonas rhizophila]|uniref:Barstar (Barnase inhibitor) n=1 Tax=Stenotrophomonas rhizophila TaxID=216778 RepID=A0A498CD00_9GAMM|nr:barstar family protein [Stenotrophomonas rhizophila]RLK50101.1 barstar (barnase inhibitor) [Stenotrophomonas rhizophila]